jgi:hypothetical protein
VDNASQRHTARSDVLAFTCFLKCHKTLLSPAVALRSGNPIPPSTLMADLGVPHRPTGLGRFIPYFRNPEHILRLKLDCFLLLWMFVAGIMKEMDQSATTQAYVSGMKEDLSLYSNELNWFQTYFSIAYAIFIVPSQLLQTKLRPSLWLPFAEMGWGVLTLL